MVHGSGVQGSEVVGSQHKSEVQSELYMAVVQQYITKAEFHDVYDLAGYTRATSRGFIKYLLSYEQDQKKATLNL